MKQQFAAAVHEKSRVMHSPVVHAPALFDFFPCQIGVERAHGAEETAAPDFEFAFISFFCGARKNRGRGLIREKAKIETVFPVRRGFDLHGIAPAGKSDAFPDIPAVSLNAEKRSRKIFRRKKQGIAI